ncbi:MAG: hypothetical protein R3B06_10975 [Kofleriaceae bacterium]
MSVVLAGAVGVARGDPAPTRSSADLDGIQLWLGPGGLATRVEGRWESTWGGTVGVVRVSEHRTLATVGGWFGAAHYASRDGGRLWLEATLGTRAVGGYLLGVAAGPTVELGVAHHPRGGGAVALWGFAGIQPVVRVGWLDGPGAFVEVGVSLAVPAWRW